MSKTTQIVLIGFVFNLGMFLFLEWAFSFNSNRNFGETFTWLGIGVMACLNTFFTIIFPKYFEDKQKEKVRNNT